MSVLRRVKLRTPDGIESIEYPLGVDAENVEVANGENLSQRLARIDEDLENNEEDIAAVNEIAGTNRQNIGAAEVRIDALERRSISLDKKPYYFNTVADMKAYQGLKVGDMAITLGYYEANDGGAAEYQIVQGAYVNNNKTVIKLSSNETFALFITPKQLNTVMFGDTNNSTQNDSAFLQFVFDYCSQHNIPGLLYKNKIYNIGTSIKINSNTYIDFNNATFYMPNNTNKHFLYNMDNYSTQTNEIHDITLINGKVDGNNINNYSGNLTGMFIVLYYCRNFTIKNFKIERCQRNNLQFYECSYIVIENVKFLHVCDVNPESVIASSAITIYNRENKIKGKYCIIKNVDVDEYGFGALFFLNYDNIIMENMNFTNGVLSPALSIPVTITECHYIECNNLYIDKTSTVAIEINTNSKQITFNNLKITNSFQPLTFGPNTKPESQNEQIYFNNCYFETVNTYFLSYSNTRNVYFNNCYIKNGGVASSRVLADKLFFNNCIMENVKLNYDYYVAHIAYYSNCTINQFLINKMLPIKSHGS